MKGFFSGLLFLMLFLFSGCIEVVEYITRPVASFEDSGLIVKEEEYFGRNGEKKTSDWLLIMYMDADNNLESAIRSDFNEVEKGLSLIRNADGSARTGFYSVRVVVLWDGRQPNDSRVFELGADSYDSYLPGSLTYNIQNFKSFYNSNRKHVDMSCFNSKEVNMSKGETLTNFLEWVDHHYQASRGKILHVADHGSGPGLNTRAMCEDSTDKTMSMSSMEFSEALGNAGYGSGLNIFDALLLDVCLGASLEDAYQFKGCASYMIASPNNTPGTGFNYEYVMRCFVGGYDSKTVSISIGRSFAQVYGAAIYDRDLGNYPTITVINLSKITDCVLKIDSLADAIKSYKNTYGDYLKYDVSMTNSLCYKGSVSWLFDAGYFADKVQINPNSSEDFKSKARELKESLASTIEYSWRRNIYSSDEDVKFKCLGITVCGNSISDYNGNSGIPAWYKNMKFSQSGGSPNNGWCGMLLNWYGNYSPTNN